MSEFAISDTSERIFLLNTIEFAAAIFEARTATAGRVLSPSVCHSLLHLRTGNPLSSPAPEKNAGRPFQ